MGKHLDRCFNLHLYLTPEVITLFWLISISIVVWFNKHIFLFVKVAIEHQHGSFLLFSFAFSKVMTSHEKALYLPHSGSDCTIYCICLYVQVRSYTLNTSTPTCATICLFSSTSYTNSRIHHSLGILHSYIRKYSEQLSQPQKNPWQYVEILNRSCKFVIKWLPCVSFLD